MQALLTQYGTNLWASFVVVLVSTVAALGVAFRASRAGRPRFPTVARVLAGGSVALVLVTTALPNEWPIVWTDGGDLILQPGMGGLRWLTVELRRFPQTLASVLLVANVLVYVPLGAFATFGWGTRFVVWGFLASLALSLAVEAVQFVGLDGVAATDDVILNGFGAFVGCLLGVLALRTRRASPAPSREDLQRNG